MHSQSLADFLGASQQVATGDDLGGGGAHPVESLSPAELRKRWAAGCVVEAAKASPESVLYATWTVCGRCVVQDHKPPTWIPAAVVEFRGVRARETHYVALCCAVRALTLWHRAQAVWLVCECAHHGPHETMHSASASFFRRYVGWGRVRRLHCITSGELSLMSQQNAQIRPADHGSFGWRRKSRSGGCVDVASAPGHRCSQATRQQRGTIRSTPTAEFSGRDSQHCGTPASVCVSGWG